MASDPVAVRWAKPSVPHSILGIVILDGIVCRDCREPLVYVQRWSRRLLVEKGSRLRHFITAGCPVTVEVIR